MLKYLIQNWISRHLVKRFHQKKIDLSIKVYNVIHIIYFRIYNNLFGFDCRLIYIYIIIWKN